MGGWLKEGRIDVKRDDALAMLRLMKDRLADQVEPMAVDYSVEHTTMWAVAAAGMAAEGPAADTSDQADDDEALLDELRLDPRYDGIRRAGLLRLLALDAVGRLGLEIDDGRRREAGTAFRLERKLQRGADLRRWLEDRGLDRRGFERLLDESFLLDQVIGHLQPKAADFVIDELRLNGDYGRLAARAAAKRRLADAMPHDRKLTDDREAVTWYFRHWMDAPPPDDLDAFARRRGFRNGDDFRRAVLEDYRYRAISDEASIDEGQSPPQAGM